MSYNRIRVLREEKGMSQAELSDRLGLKSSGSMSKYENGQIPLSEQVLRMLSIVFDVSVDYILALSDDRKRGSSRSSARITWDAALLVEAADKLPEAERAVLAAYAKDPEALAVAGRFLRLSARSRRRVVEYMDLPKLADDAGSSGEK